MGHFALIYCSSILWRNFLQRDFSSDFPDYFSGT
jgi:hypothetical protein